MSLEVVTSSSWTFRSSAILHCVEYQLQILIALCKSNYSSYNNNNNNNNNEFVNNNFFL